jgi:hypothetical protein
MSDNNPLRQFFRRPALYLKLPSGGKGYPVGAIDMPANGELPVYPMTAIDEITSRTPDALYNGTAVTEIIRSCVPNIKDAWSVLSIDLDPLLVAIKIATNGNTMELNTACPACDETAKYDIELSRILAGFQPGDYDSPLVLGDVAVKFNPLSYTQANKANDAQFQVQKMLKNLEQTDMDPEERSKKTSEILFAINDMSTVLLSETIENITVPDAIVSEKEYIIEYLKNCDKNVYEKIKDRNFELRQGTETKPLKFKCVECSHEYEQPFEINMTDFFV